MIIDLMGKRFGRLTVIERNGSRKYLGATGKLRCSFAVWRCRCDCGGEKVTTSRCLIAGKTISCGCARKETKYPEGKAFTRLFQSYKNNANRRGIAFALTDREFAKLVSSPCHYTGRLPSRASQYRGDSILYNGVDRKDPTKGYISDNCVPCCFEINRAKSDLTIDTFLGLIDDVARHVLKLERVATNPER